MTGVKQYDFRSMSFYQIWIRSFCDGNGDGIGDLYGVYDKLEYIKSLGVDGIWFSPIYPSPNADYGYDISDYRNIHPDYGDLAQFKKVLQKAHGLGLKVILDLVINHTSDEHPWFLESRKGKDNPYSDYYIWRDPKWKRRAKRPPNNWFSQFEGLAWEYDDLREQYYLHVFAKKQPDLNMDNPKVREEVKGIMRFWLDMGVDGFREDVITYISKHPQLPDGIPFLPAINGLPFYKDGPNLLTYLKEFREVAREYGAIQIGEAPMTPVKTALRYLTGEDRVLDMMIQFDTMMADCFLTEFVHHGFWLAKLKRAFSRWQYALAGKAWNALYLENHDHPRVISRYGSEKYWRESGTMLAACYLFQQGTPFIYQGQEIGMTNIRLSSIDQYKDVASIHAYHAFYKHGSEEKRMHRIHLASRDSARTPMQWSVASSTAVVCRQSELYADQCGTGGTGSRQHLEFLSPLLGAAKEQSNSTLGRLQGILSAQPKNLPLCAQLCGRACSGHLFLFRARPEVPASQRLHRRGSGVAAVQLPGGGNHRHPSPL